MAARLGPRLDALRDRYAASADPALVAEVVGAVLETLACAPRGAERHLLAEFQGLAEVIDHAKREIAALRVDDINAAFIPSATDELDAIVADTAGATHAILDACERIEAGAASAPTDLSATLFDATRGIYEACSFQDITGQRIGKVVRTLKTIEGRIAAVVEACRTIEAPAPAASPQAARGGGSAAASPGENTLLNGPQLAGAGNDQAEIDRLLASLEA